MHKTRHTRRVRVSSATDGELKYFHVVRIPAIHAGMTEMIKYLYNSKN